MYPEAKDVRWTRLAARVIPAVLLATVLGCRAAPTDGEKSPTPPDGPDRSTVGSQPFLQIGNRALTNVVPPESYLLVRCGYRAGETWRDIPCKERLAQAPAEARREFGSILLLIDDQRAAARDNRASEPGSRFHRVYHLAPLKNWIADLEIFDMGGPEPLVHVVARINKRQAHVQATTPALLAHLRKSAYEALRESMRRPRWALEWHYLALPVFLNSDPPPATTQTIREETLRHLKSAPDPGPLARVLLEHVAHFEERELAPLLQNESIALRLLPLVRAAVRGDGEALREVFTLSLEYHGEALLFRNAAQALFPRALNPELYPAAADDAPLAFLRNVHRQIDRAVYVEDQGWKIERS